MNSQPLSKEDISRVIEGRGHAARVPLAFHFWTSTAVFGEKKEEAARLLDTVPCDIDVVELNFPQVKTSRTPEGAYVWNQKPLPDEALSRGHDNRSILETWDDLDAFLNAFPTPWDPRLIPQRASSERYRLVSWWYCLFERLWEFRGMENALMDFYLYPEEVHRLFEKLTEFYLTAIERAASELGANGVFVSDDLGTQTSPFFSVDLFREFFKPCYKKLFDRAHELGMHFWLHSCGNIEPLLPEFIDIGLDVIHPIQKYTMDDAQIARKYGGDICLWYGFDVQQILPYGTAQDVRDEVRRIMETFKRGDGRFMLTMGNNATPDWPLENLRVLYEESLRLGSFEEEETPSGQTAP